jgi:hypothetical protein
MIETLTLFRQLIYYLPKGTFHSEVLKFEANKYVKQFDTWSHFLVLLASQIKGWSSLREIESGFNVHQNLIYHLGISTLPKRSNLSKANTSRNYKVYENTFYKLLNIVMQRLEPIGLKVKKEITLFDSTVISVSLELFKWATFRKDGGFKIHTAFNVNKSVPTYAKITHGNINDITGIPNNLDEYIGGIVVFDKGYFSFDLFKKLTNKNIKFVTRIKKTVSFEIVKTKLVKGSIKADMLIKMTGSKGKRKYSKELRLIRYYDKKRDKELEFLTNEFDYSATTIAYLYKKRWEIELFFKWIKQNLKIKRFLGTSENAVNIQVWVALITYVLLSYVQAQCNYKGGMLKFTRVVREMLFENIGLLDLMSDKFISHHLKNMGISPEQLTLEIY